MVKETLREFDIIILCIIFLILQEIFFLKFVFFKCICYLTKVHNFIPMPTSGTPSENGQSSPPVSGAALDFLQSSSSNTSTESTSTSSMYSDFFDTSSS